MSETTDTPAAPSTDGSRGRSGLNAKLMPELRAIAAGLGIKTVGLKKADLVGAITGAQSGGQPSGQSGGRSGGRSSGGRSAGRAVGGAEESASSAEQGPQAAETRVDPPVDETGAAPQASVRTTRRRTREVTPETPAGPPAEQPVSRTEEPAEKPAEQPGDQSADERRNDPPKAQRRRERQNAGERQNDGASDNEGREDNRNGDRQANDRQANDRQANDRQANDRQANDRQANDRPARDRQTNEQPSNGAGQPANQPAVAQDQDDEQGGRRNRRRRGRDRERTPTTGSSGANGSTTNGSGSSGGSSGSSGSGSMRGSRSEPDTQILEDDVLTPCAGILDVLDNYAFVRTSGYLPGTDDVYVSLSMVRKLGLRRGDAITGQVRQPREGERKEKFNPLVAIDSVNGGDPEASRSRLEFDKLTPLYPSERLRLETDPTNLIGRIVDIAAPVGKGQRGLIISPAKAGKTMILQSIASSISKNHPECHLMVVLVDERPEEVTDFERSVNGEVIASTFDRPAGDHTTVAELAIERAKRLVELGHDVVVLLDGITRLGRAYNLASPVSGRILAGGVDSAALYPPKRFFGAARNIENGGSLTIVATALVESGSKTDEVIFEEFQGTANMEIRLRGDIADKRIFPAIDAVQSGTRREELLMGEEELAIVWKLRRVLASLDGEQALELLLERLRKTRSNVEFLTSVQKSTPKPGSNAGATTTP